MKKCIYSKLTDQVGDEVEIMSLYVLRRKDKRNEKRISKFVLNITKLNNDTIPHRTRRKSHF